MGTKRMIKLLMAEGVQRNDAAAFVRAYHKVKEKPAIKLFPELVNPPAPLVRTKTVYPSAYAVQHVMPKAYISSAPIEVEHYVKGKLVEKLANGLQSSGVILFEHKEYANDVIFTAKIRVLPPEASEVYALGSWDG